MFRTSEPAAHHILSCTNPWKVTWDGDGRTFGMRNTRITAVDTNILQLSLALLEWQNRGPRRWDKHCFTYWSLPLTCFKRGISGVCTECFLRSSNRLAYAFVTRSRELFPGRQHAHTCPMRILSFSSHFFFMKECVPAMGFLKRSRNAKMPGAPNQLQSPALNCQR